MAKFLLLQQSIMSKFLVRFVRPSATSFVYPLSGRSCSSCNCSCRHMFATTTTITTGTVDGNGDLPSTIINSSSSSTFAITFEDRNNYKLQEEETVSMKVPSTINPFHKFSSGDGKVKLPSTIKKLQEEAASAMPTIVDEKRKLPSTINPFHNFSSDEGTIKKLQEEAASAMPTIVDEKRKLPSTINPFHNFSSDEGKVKLPSTIKKLQEEAASAMPTIVDEKRKLPSTINSSPWLMLPTVPATASNPEGAAMPMMVHQFYSLSEKRVITINKKSSQPDPDAHCVGSSNGWVGFINRRPDFDFFLLNPITGRSIKLPSIRMLFIHTDFFWNECKKDAFWNILNFVLSSPNPDAEDCRVVVLFRTRSFSSYNEHTKLAYCCPGLGDCDDNESSSWGFLDPPSNQVIFNQYANIEYSPKDQRFFVLANFFHIFSHREEEVQMECWDLNDPWNPKRYPLVPGKKGRLARMDRHWKSYHECKKPIMIDRSYLIADPSSSGQLFLIDRFAYREVVPDQDLVRTDYGNIIFKPGSSFLPHKTVRFDVYKFDTRSSNSRRLEYMESLDDRAFFIGLNRGFCLSASEYPELKPNSIYFTDDLAKFSFEKRWGGHDIGIYNYEDKTIDECYYPIPDDAKNYKTIEPVPVWFTPTHV